MICQIKIKPHDSNIYIIQHCPIREYIGSELIECGNTTFEKINGNYYCARCGRRLYYHIEENHTLIVIEPLEE